MPAVPTGELEAILRRAAFAPIAHAFLRITGPDAPRWLNGMVTNNIQALNPGEGNYNFLLNAQGRIQGDATIYREPAPGEPTFLLETDPAQLETIHPLLDRFIIMDDVELTTTQQHSILLLGPNARLILGDIESGDYLGDTQPIPGPLELRRPYADLQVTTPSAGLVSQFILTSDNSAQAGVTAQTLQAAGAIQASLDALEAFRILEARPRYSADIRNTDTAKDLPQETNQTHALHFAKGCYLGQEIVERIRSRGQVHRLFTPFRLDGPPPPTLPAPLQVNGKAAGELTSATTILTTEGPVTLALGYARREFLDTHAAFTYAGGTALARTPGQLD